MFTFGGLPDFDAAWFWCWTAGHLPQSPHLKPYLQPLHKRYLPSYKGRDEMSWSDSSTDTCCCVQWSTFLFRKGELVKVWSWVPATGWSWVPWILHTWRLGLPVPGLEDGAGRPRLPTISTGCMCASARVCVWRFCPCLGVLWWFREILDWLGSTQVSKWFLDLQK